MVPILLNVLGRLCSSYLLSLFSWSQISSFDVIFCCGVFGVVTCGVSGIFNLLRSFINVSSLVLCGIYTLDVMQTDLVLVCIFGGLGYYFEPFLSF